jgi:endonuclease III related protein
MKQETSSNKPGSKVRAPRFAEIARLALPQYYDTLFSTLGPRNWWPGESPFEVIVGAILTQNAAWVNVARAIENLRQEGMLSVRSMESARVDKLERLIRSSGYFRQKAKKLKAFLKFLRRRFGGSLARMFRTPVDELRGMLLEVHGIGPETADSILLYAGEYPVFVVDAYTKRVLERHALIPKNLGYEEVRNFFETTLPRETRLYNEFHALIVETGKQWCRTKPLCEECPLKPFLPGARTTVSSEAIRPVEALA